jgi:hypothetical protein
MSVFKVDGVYANRKGKYTVLNIDEPFMTVRYTSGEEALLKIPVQARIWENILAEQEAKAASRSARAARRPGVVHYIKVVSIPPGEDLTFPGWPERVIMIQDPTLAETIKASYRLIYYAMEAQTFFAVATITGEAFEADPKKYTFTTDIESAIFFPIDVDAEARSLEKGVTIDSVELEGYPNFKKMRMQPEALFKISEDDFELLAEALTEISEEEEEELEEEEFDEEEDE